MDCRAWLSRHRPTLTMENGASPPRGAPLPVSPEHPLVCCLSFALSSLPLCLFLTLSHRLTQWRHSRTTGHTVTSATSSLSFFLFLLSSSVLWFSLLSFSLYFLIHIHYCSTAVQQVSNLFLFYSFTYLIVSQQIFFLFFYLFQ